MKHTTFFSSSIFLSVVLAACTSGGSTESSRPPQGNPNAAVVLEEYADLQCPACRAAHSTVTQPILEKYGEQIRFDFKHFPLRNIHRFALDTAEMSECVADQGKFWEFVDIVYEKQPELSLEILTEWAQEAGANPAEAEKCWKSHSKRGVVLEDYKIGREKGVAGTPTYFVNGQRVQAGVDTLGAAIEAALEGTINRL